MFSRFNGQRTPQRLIIAGALAIFASTYAMSADIHLARNLSATCANCHGTNGKAADGEIKAIAGIDKDKLLGTLKDYASGEKPATVMHQIAKGYTEAQLALIAEYFSKQK